MGTRVQCGAAAEDILATYAGNEDAVYAMAGWFAVVLLGRVLLFIGLRQALADSWRRHPLLDFAVVASAVSVTLEIASYRLAASASAYADTGEDTLAVAMDQAGAGLNLMIGGGGLGGDSLGCQGVHVIGHRVHELGDVRSGLFACRSTPWERSRDPRSSAPSARSLRRWARSSRSSISSRSSSGSGCCGPAWSAGATPRTASRPGQWPKVLPGAVNLVA